MMNLEELKKTVGVAGNVTISSERRYSELLALAELAGTREQGLLTIVVKPGTLRNSEIAGLVRVAGKFLALDFTKC